MSENTLGRGGKRCTPWHHLTEGWIKGATDQPSPCRQLLNHRHGHCPEEDTKLGRVDAWSEVFSGSQEVLT